MKYIAYDLGTGGVKASLYDERFNTLAKSFIAYDTHYPQSFMHEQRPEDWWQGVIKSTQILISEAKISPGEIGALALSGQSLVSVPFDKDLNMLMEQVPIWSDTRATTQSERFFEKVDKDEWYLTTGNGFPAPCYSVFKLMWFRENMPEIYEKTFKVVGSKDYINFRLTGNLATDHSYASGTGAYDLKAGAMSAKFLKAAGLKADLFSDIVSSHTVVGKVSEAAAKECGLAPGTLVACGGVDNACMALGACGATDGSGYVSLGSSSWIPVNCKNPVVDTKKLPYTFAHIEENMFTSAYSIFSGGSSLKWVRDNIFNEFSEDENSYDIIAKMASTSPVGANGVFFNPSLAGGTSQDKSINIRGSFLGLHLGATREDLARATFEGITMSLKMSLDALAEKTELSDTIRICGGGAKSKFWMSMFADVFNMTVVKTNIDQDAASLGAAAIAARAGGAISDYSVIDTLHKVEFTAEPNPENAKKYSELTKTYAKTCAALADIGDLMIQR